jgi:alpha-glucosidase
VRSRSVSCPAGRLWCNFWTGEWHEGGQTIEVAAPLEKIPLFVPDGGMIPMGKPMRHVGAEVDDVRQLYIFPHPGGGHSTFTLIEDDGLSFGYQRGEYTEVIVEAIAEADTLTLNVRRQQQGYNLPYDKIEFILPTKSPLKIVQTNEANQVFVDTRLDSDFRTHVYVKVQ